MMQPLSVQTSGFKGRLSNARGKKLRKQSVNPEVTVTKTASTPTLQFMQLWIPSGGRLG